MTMKKKDIIIDGTFLLAAVLLAVGSLSLRGHGPAMTIEESVTTANDLPYHATLVDDLAAMYSPTMDSCGQLLMVWNEDAHATTALLTAYERTDSGWVVVNELDSVVVGLGYNGFALYGQKREGDRKTPTGLFSIHQYFCKNNDHEAKLQRIAVTPQTVWVDDPSDSLYNKPYEPDGQSVHKGEKLYRSGSAVYDYAFVIDYNTECKPGEGSAIFFHCWGSGSKNTLGCVATDKEKVIKVLDWLDSAQHPLIIMGTRNDSTHLFDIPSTKEHTNLSINHKVETI